MMDQNTRSETNAPKDPQEKYDENVQKHSLGDLEELKDDLPQKYSGRFPRDFYRYSQDFHDRENGGPGIDQDFGLRIRTSEENAVLPKQMPEGDGVAESTEDREVREAITDFLTRNESLAA